jgi:hypothetical protein
LLNHITTLFKCCHHDPVLSNNKSELQTDRKYNLGNLRSYPNKIATEADDHFNKVNNGNTLGDNNLEKANGNNKIQLNNRERDNPYKYIINVTAPVVDNEQENAERLKMIFSVIDRAPKLNLEVQYNKLISEVRLSIQMFCHKE